MFRKRFLIANFVLSALTILLIPALVVGQVSSSPLPPEAFQRAMVFVDGTNLFYRLESLKVIVPSFIALLKLSLGRRDLLRSYLYTIREHYEKKGREIHGAEAFNNIRVVFGEGVPTEDGNFREKGVDALLVSDLIYHAAHKNIDYAVVVSVDADFSRAIQRVEDFGCRTAVLAVGSQAPDSLRTACDNYYFISREELLRKRIASEAK